MHKHIIFNADDFGASDGVNQGIIYSHQQGVVTSTSVMVTGRKIDDALAMARDNPALALGLHWDVWGEDERKFNLKDLDAVKSEFYRQLDLFNQLVGRPPTHIDSHRHAHQKGKVFELFLELVEPLNVPLRGDGKVNFVGGFYAQWEWKVTNLEHISVEALCKMLQEETKGGWTEFSCHPGYVTDDYQAVYLQEREHEIKTLTDARVAECITKLGLKLTSYAEYKNLIQV